MSRWNKKTFTYKGVTKTIREWADENGIKYSTLLGRIKLGIAEDQIMNKELFRRPYKKRTVRKGSRDALPYTWSDLAVSCYEIGCTCYWCKDVPGDLKKHCKMKETVFELVKRYGKPERTDK